MGNVIHRSENMGFSDHGWLKTYHAFSCGTYYDPRRIHFGALRTLNEDIIAGGEGFASHSHENMEIIVIPLKGAMEHGDNIGNYSVVSEGDIQVVSAGTGIIHNSYNLSCDEPLIGLNIWIFPREYETPPAYSKVRLAPIERNELRMVACPDTYIHGGEHVALLKQDAWIYTADIDQGSSVKYTKAMECNGVYVYLLDGESTVNDTKLRKRDGLGIDEAVEVQVLADTPSKILIIEVPMKKTSVEY